MVKRLVNIALVVISLITMASCTNETARLAKEVEGSWSGAPGKMAGAPADEATIIETLDFLGSDSVNGGNIIINAMISMTGAVTGGQETFQQPVSLSATASANISGTWRAIDDDEISVTLDTRSLDVNVDPKAVMVSTNILTGSDSPSLDSITPGIAAQIRIRLAESLSMRYMAMKYLEDVKVKHNILTYELGGIDYTFQRQGIAIK